MQQSQKTAAEAEAQGDRRLRLIVQGGIVELQLFQRIPEIGIFRTIRRIKSAVDHGLHLAVAGQRLLAGVVRIRHGIADSRVLDILDGRGDIAYHARRKLVTGDKLSCSEVADLDNLLLRPGRHHLNRRAAPYRTLHHTAEDYDAPVGIVHRVKDQRLQRCRRVSLRRRNLFYNLLQNLLDADAVLRRNQGSVLRLNTDDVLDLLLYPFGIRARKIDLINDRENIQIVVEGKIDVCKRLRLDSLCCVHDKDRTVARRKGTAHFIIKVHMSGGIDQIENIFFSVLRLVHCAHRLRFDRDSPLALQLHVVQHLILHLALRQKTCLLDNAVCQR